MQDAEDKDSIMTVMNILDVINIVYPGQSDAGNVTVGQDGDNIFITMWKVPSVEQPTTEQLEAQIPSLQNQFDLQCLIVNGSLLIKQYTDEVAQEKQYDSAVSCASYAGSTNDLWKRQALTFAAWRDSVYEYSIQAFNDIEAGKIPVPTLEEFKANMPVIVWPN